jgi:hypothetical protein
MKKPILAILLLPAILFSCSKDGVEPAVIRETATISSTKVPCGPACTAEAWLLVAGNNISYEPINLPESYKIAQLQVTVALKKTGLRSDNVNGTGQEQVEVLDISRR